MAPADIDQPVKLDAIILDNQLANALRASAAHSGKLQGSNRVPTSAEEAARVLVDCAGAGQSVHIAGTDVGARFIAPSSVTLCTSKLGGINTYAPDDLYVKV